MPCAVCGHVAVLDLLVDYGADLNAADRHLAYPVHYAAQMTKTPRDEDTAGAETGGSGSGAGAGAGAGADNTLLLRKLLDRQVSPEVRDKDQRTPVIWAASAGVCR